MDIKIPQTLEEWNAAGAEYLPGHLGFSFIKVEPQEVVAKLTARKALGAWNGYLHAGAVVTLADTCCGYGTVRGLPQGASGLHHHRAQEQLLRLGARGHHRVRRAASASGPYHPGVGRHRYAGGRGQADRAVPQHANDAVAEGVASRHPQAGGSSRRDAGTKQACYPFRPSFVALWYTNRIGCERKGDADDGLR